MPFLGRGFTRGNEILFYSLLKDTIVFLLLAAPRREGNENFPRSASRQPALYHTAQIETLLR